MTLDVVCFIFGAVLLGIALFGGIKGYVDVDAPPPRLRFFSGGAGLVFIFTAMVISGQIRMPSIGSAATSTPTAGVSASSTNVTHTATLESSPSPAPPPTATSTPEATPTPLPPASLPIPSLAEQPLLADEIGIIVHVDLSGPGKERGEETLYGITFDLATRIAQLPPALQSRIAVRYVDDEGDPAKAKQVAAQVAQLPNVVAVLGLNRSATALEALTEYDRATIPAISISATNSQLTDKELYPNQVLRCMVTSDDAHAAFAVRFIKQQNIKTIRIFYVNDPYGQALSAAVEQGVRQAGITATARWSLPSNPTPQEIVNAVATVDPSTELVFFAGYYNQAALLFPAIRGQYPAIKLLGSDGVDNPDVVKAGSSIDGMYYTSIAAPVDEFPRLNDLAAAYQNAHPRLRMPTYLGESYDAMGLALRSVAEAAQQPGGVSRATTYAAFVALTGVGRQVDGVAGPYRFTGNGGLENPVFYIRQYTGGPWPSNPIVLKGTR